MNPKKFYAWKYHVVKSVSKFILASNQISHISSDHELWDAYEKLWSCDKRYLLTVAQTDCESF